MTKDIAQQWLDLFIEDGWTITPLSESSKSDKNLWVKAEDSTGWRAHIDLRDYPHSKLSEEERQRVHVWAPDDLAVIVTNQPSLDSLVAAQRYCIFCNTFDVDTVRISFAGRCCTHCRKDEELVRKLEYPGWAN